MPPSAFFQLCCGFGYDGNSLERQILLACLFAYVGDSDRSRFDYAGDDAVNGGLSIRLLTELFEPVFDSTISQAAFTNSLERVVNDRLVRISLLGDQQESAGNARRYVFIEQNIADLLYGAEALDQRLSTIARIRLPESDQQPSPTPTENILQILDRWIKHQRSIQPGLLLLLIGLYGTGRRRAAESLAHSSCQRLIVLEVATLINSEEQWKLDDRWKQIVDCAYHAAACRNAMLYWNGVEHLLNGENPCVG